MFPKTISMLSGGSEKVPYALYFNGTDNYLTISNNFESSNMSILAWHWMTPNGNKIIFDNREGTSDGILMYNGADEEPWGLVNPRQLNYDQASAGSNWQHQAMVVDSSTPKHKLFVNGKLQDFDTNVETISLSTSTSTIGARNFSTRTNFFQSYLAEVAIYDRALTTDEVGKIYNGGDFYNHKEGLYKDNLWAWYRMGNGAEQASGTTIYDMSGNGINATMNNMDNTNYVEKSPFN